MRAAPNPTRTRRLAKAQPSRDPLMSSRIGVAGSKKDVKHPKNSPVISEQQEQYLLNNPGEMAGVRQVRHNNLNGLTHFRVESSRVF